MFYFDIVPCLTYQITSCLPLIPLFHLFPTTKIINLFDVCFIPTEGRFRENNVEMQCAFRTPRPVVVLTHNWSSILASAVTECRFNWHYIAVDSVWQSSRGRFLFPVIYRLLTGALILFVLKRRQFPHSGNDRQPVSIKLTFSWTKRCSVSTSCWSPYRCGDDVEVRTYTTSISRQGRFRLRNDYCTGPSATQRNSVKFHFGWTI